MACSTAYNTHARPATFNKWKRLRTRAQQREKPFSLSEQEYGELIGGNRCHYCENTLPPRGYGLDRIDNARGYEPGNCVPCCTNCNSIRGDKLTYEEMLELAPALRRIFARRAQSAAA